MGSRFPESGQSVVLDLSGWTGPFRIYLQNIKQMEQAEDASAEKSRRAGKGKQQFAKDVGQAGSESKKAAGGIRSAGEAAARAGNDAQRGAGGFSRFTENLLNINNAINITRSAVGTIQNIGGAINDMTERAARVESVSRAFERISTPIGGAEAALASLREQSQGAVSDLELMRLTNKALINSTAEFTDAVGPNFGTVIQAAFAGAAATGQSLDVVLDKVVTGLRRGSNMLLDDIGIWVNADQAQAAYAQSLGLTVGALTEQQKQAAFAAEAIRQMGDITAAAGGASSSLAVQMAQNAAITENAMNRLAASAAPAIGQFQAGFGQIGAVVAESLSYLDPAPFFEGGANIIAAIAHGILSGLTLIVQAVTVVAQTIANFLRGFSPPKEGPLSDIDVGGENVIKAWMDRFNGVSLDPVRNLASNVSDILGETASLSTDDQIAVLENLQNRLEERTRKAVAGLSRGEVSAEEVRALDEQRAALDAQLRQLRERADLERIFGDQAAETQDRLDAIASSDFGGGGGATGGSGASAGGDYTKPIEEGLRLDTTEADKAAKGEKDKLADLQEKLAANLKLQDEYNAAGLETNDLLRDQARLTEQIAAEESARGQDNAKTLAALGDLQSQLETPSTGGGGGGGGAPALDLGDLGGSGGAPATPDTTAIEELGVGLGAGSTAGLAAGNGPISQAFQRIEDDLTAFTDAFQEAKDTLEGIDLFGAIGDFFARLQEIDTPDELITFIGDLVAELAQLPSEVAQGLIDFFTDLTGIELPGWLEEGIKIAALAGGFSLLATALGPIAGLIGGIVAAFGPMIFFATLIGIFIDAINQKWGSFEGALEVAGVTIDTFVSAGRIAFENLRTGIETVIDAILSVVFGMIDEVDKISEGLGIDLGIDVSGHIDALEARANARELRDQAVQEMRNVMDGTQTEFSPVVQIAAREGMFEIPEEVRYTMRNLLRVALENGDLGAAIHVTAMAENIGLDLPPEQLIALGEQLSAGIDSGLDFLSIEPEVQALVVSGQVSVSPSASNIISNAVEAAIVVGDITQVEPEVLAAVIDGRLSVSENARTVAERALDDSINGEGPLTVEHAEAVINDINANLSDEAKQAVAEQLANDLVSGVNDYLRDAGLIGGGATRSGSFGAAGLPPSLTGFQPGLMGGREAAAQDVGPLTDIISARFGSGLGGESDFSAITAQFDELLVVITDKTEQAREVFLEGFLVPVNEQFAVLGELFPVFNEELTLTGTTLLVLNPALGLFTSTTLLLNPQLLLWSTTLAVLNPLLLLQLTTTTELGTSTATLTANTLAMSAASVVATGTLALLNVGYSDYIQTVDVAIERTLEFIEVVQAIPHRIDVVLGVTLEIPNLTSIGAGVADALAGADAAAIGAPHRAGGGKARRGSIYWVGEAGPELFFADDNGFIAPNDQIMVAPPTPSMGSMVSTVDNSQQHAGNTFNFYGPADGQSIRRVANEMVMS